MNGVEGELNGVEGEFKDDAHTNRPEHDPLEASILEASILEASILEGNILEDAILEGESELESLSGADLETAAVLSYAAPTRVPAANLKARLFDRLACLASEPESRPEANSDLRSGTSPQATGASALFDLLLQPIETLKQVPDPLPWHPIVVAPGFEMATWKIDLAYNYIAVFIRAESKANFPLHQHSEEEALLVLAGDLTVEEQVYQAGDRIDSRPSSQHALKTQTGCLVLVIASRQDLQQV